jgi:hypothetical protein
LIVTEAGKRPTNPHEKEDKENNFAHQKPKTKQSHPKFSN